MATRPNGFYTVRELAEYLKVTGVTIHRLIRKGELPVYRVGRAIRIRASDVEAYLERRRAVALLPDEAQQASSVGTENDFEAALLEEARAKKRNGRKKR